MRRKGTPMLIDTTVVKGSSGRMDINLRGDYIESSQTSIMASTGAAASNDSSSTWANST